MKGKAKKPIVFMSIFASIGMGLGFALGNYVYLILALNELLGLSLRLSSTLIFLVNVIILWRVVEPEKIKPLAYILSAFIFGSGKNCSLFNRKDHLLMIESYDIDVE